jgi:mono/diheme cytochrome c family protein
MNDKPVGKDVVVVALLGLLVVATLGACGGGSGSAGGAAADGERLYNSNCALCHGMGGVGKPALGKDLRDNAFVAGMTDDEVVQFLAEGRRADHPLNEKGVDMPPKGGNPGLTEEDLRAIVVYLRGLS